MTEYRQRPGRDVWHFHPRCQWWPLGGDLVIAPDRYFLTTPFKTRTKKPTYGELCNECQAKAKRDGEG